MEVPTACCSHDLDKSPVISCAQMPCHVRLPALQDELAQLMERSWVDHVNSNDSSGGWSVLPLRCQCAYVEAHPVLQGFAIANGEDWQDLPVLGTCPELNTFLQSLQCPLKSVRLMRLNAGAEIKPHRDHGLSLEYGEARLHLPLQTSNDVHFFVNHQRIPMRAGELWYINANQEHAVQNLSDEDRINLVIDCVANAWLREQVVVGWQQDSGQHKRL